MLQTRNPYIFGNGPCFNSVKFSLFDITYHRQSLDSHIDFDLPTHVQDMQWPIK